MGIDYYCGGTSCARFSAIVTFLSQLRRRPRLIRSVFAVFVLAWLQTAFLPCAMATMGAEQATHAVSGQLSDVAPSTADTASVAMADMPDCVYCPPEQKQNSDTGASVHNCLYPQESRVDSGKAQQGRLDQLIAYPVFISSSAFGLLPAPTEVVSPQQYLIPPLSERSLHLTYCKQLK